jgi:hypothetical protein
MEGVFNHANTVKVSMLIGGQHLILTSADYFVFWFLGLEGGVIYSRDSLPVPYAVRGVWQNHSAVLP